MATLFEQLAGVTQQFFPTLKKPTGVFDAIAQTLGTAKTTTPMPSFGVSNSTPQTISKSPYTTTNPQVALDTLKGLIPGLGLGKNIATVATNLTTGLKEQFTNPSPEQKNYEAQFLPYGTTPVTKAVTAPGVFTARLISRLLNPGLQPLATDLAQIRAINEKGGIADQIAQGKLPASYLDELAVLHKTAPQIVGDVAQSVLTAYAGGEAPQLATLAKEKPIFTAIAQGLRSGLQVGTAFGTAQALSSGSTNPLEIASTIGTSGFAGSILGGITAGTIPVSKEVFGKVVEAKRLYDSMTPAERQAGFAKIPSFGEQAPDETPKIARTVFEGKTNNEDIRQIALENQDRILPTTGKYNFSTVEDVQKFLEQEKGKSRYSNVLKGDFKIDQITIDHLFGDSRSPNERIRRASLVGPALEIIENTGILAAIDSKTEPGITYYDIIGRGNTREDIIIRAKLSENNKDGKVFFTVSDISGGTRFPTTASSARSPAGFTTSEGEPILPKTNETVNPDIVPPEGQPISNDVNTKERGFVSSAKEVIPEADKIAGQYIPRPTDELAIKARNLVQSDIAAAEKLALTGVDDKAIATAAELIKHYGDEAARAPDEAAKTALYDKAAAIANPVAEKLTELGRSVQAAAILGRLTPEGQVRFAAREIQRYNEQVAKNRGGLFGLQKKIPELTGEQARVIVEEMKAIQDMPDGTEKAVRFQKLQDHVSSLVPTPLWKKIITVWKAGLLTGIKTSGTNIFANISHFSTETIKDIPAAVVDSVVALFSGERTKTFTTKGSATGLKEGFEKGIHYFKTGFDERNIATKLDYNKVNFGKGKVAKAFQLYTDTIFRMLGAQDQPFYYGALSRSLYDQAFADGINQGLKGKELTAYAEKLVSNPTEPMIRYATADAATAVFQNETYLGKAARQLQKVPIVGQILVPFGRTPSAVAMQIVNYSPIGIVKTIIENAGKGRFDQRAFSEGVGRGITGTAVLAIGAALGGAGLVALDRPTNEREQKLWELEGKKANSIKVGGKWRSPQVLGPAGNLLLIGAHFQQAFKKAGSPSEAIGKALAGTAKSFTEQTFLTGINQATTALNDPATYAASYLGNLTASLVPTVVSDIARSTDALERRAETTPQKIVARVPGLRNQLPPSVDVLGSERARVGNPIEVLADPTRPSEAIATPLIQEFRRLSDAGFPASPTLLGDKNGYDVLTQAQNTQLWKRAGDITKEKLTNLIASPEYAKLDDEQKAKLINNFVDKAKVNARAEMVIALTDGLSGDALTKELATLKAGGLLTKEVYAKYQDFR